MASGVIPFEFIVVAGIAILCHALIKRFEIACVVAWAISMVFIFWGVQLRPAFFAFWLPFMFLIAVIPTTVIVIVVGLPFHFIRTAANSRKLATRPEEIQADEGQYQVNDSDNPYEPPSS